MKDRLFFSIWDDNDSFRDISATYMVTIILTWQQKEENFTTTRTI